MAGAGDLVSAPAVCQSAYRSPQRAFPPPAEGGVLLTRVRRGAAALLGRSPCAGTAGPTAAPRGQDCSLPCCPLRRGQVTSPGSRGRSELGHKCHLGLQRSGSHRELFRLQSQSSGFRILLQPLTRRGVLGQACFQVCAMGILMVLTLMVLL